ncbi:MAG: hypothetical protein JWM80_2358 [Cyanobacteria bacterium RYN_339]|nr:hypothetical protein [Cyanobacteria bacterium RYN_339]
MNVSPIRIVTPVNRPAANNTVQAAPAPVQAAPVAVKPAVLPPKASEWTLGRISKAAGSAAGGFAAGGAATFMADLLFHFGNNGGTAWPGGIYLMGAGLVAAGALALYAKLSDR